MGWNSNKVTEIEIGDFTPGQGVSEERRANMAKNATHLSYHLNRKHMTNTMDFINDLRDEKIEAIKSFRPEYFDALDKIVSDEEFDLAYLHVPPEGYDSTLNYIENRIDDLELNLDSNILLLDLKDIYSEPSMFCYAVIPGKPLKVIISSAFVWQEQSGLDGGKLIVDEFIPNVLKHEEGNVYSATNDDIDMTKLRTIMKDHCFIENIELLEKLFD